MKHAEDNRAEDMPSRFALGVPNAARPSADLLTGGQPREDQFEALTKAGFKAVLDLRHPDESRGFNEAASVRAAGLRYVNIPVTSSLDDHTFEEFRTTLKDSDNRPALVHCASGHRVGALLIPYMVFDEGRSLGEALDVARRVGLQSKELAERALQYVRHHGTGRF